MNEKDKYRYIFVDTSFENRTRFNWITDCLLGDIRTFLDGIKYMDCISNINSHIQNEGGPAEKPLGGGNLSVPILINSALEFISALYEGKTDDRYMEFEIPKENFVNDLNRGVLTESLKNKFKNRKFPLPQNPAVTTSNPDVEWNIKDANTERIYYVVAISDREKKLQFHFLEKASYEANKNVAKFVKEFFPAEYKKMPLLLWDGVRNGLVHTFYPKTFTYHGSGQSLKCLQFDFYVKNRKEASRFVKEKDKIRIQINVFELYHVLEQAVGLYGRKLKKDPKLLQNKFIRAWSSIEEYTEEVDEEQEKEVKEICDYLGSSYIATVCNGT